MPLDVEDAQTEVVVSQSTKEGVAHVEGVCVVARRASVGDGSRGSLAVGLVGDLDLLAAEARVHNGRVDGDDHGVVRVVVAA